MMNLTLELEQFKEDYIRKLIAVAEAAEGVCKLKTAFVNSAGWQVDPLFPLRKALKELENE